MPITHQELTMDTVKALSELYHHLTSLEEAKLAKHTISALVLGAFEKLEASKSDITPTTLEKALKEEIAHFASKNSKKKKSA